MKVRTKLLIVLLFIGLAPAFLIAGLAWRSLGSMAEHSESQYELIASDTLDKIERNLFERYGDVQAFGLNTVLRENAHWYVQSEDSPIVQAMNSYVDTYDIYYLTVLVDLDGKVIAVNTRDDNGGAIDTGFIFGKDFASAKWFQDARAGRFTDSDALSGTVVEDLYIDDDVKQVYGDDGLSLGYSAPVRDADGQVIAIWKNYTKWNLVESIIAASYDTLKSNNMASAELTLLDKDGRVLIDCDPSVNGKLFNTDLQNVVMKLNLAEKGVGSAQDAVAGNNGHGRGLHARKQVWQTSGWAHSEGALGYPGLNWSLLGSVGKPPILFLIAGSVG